MNTKFAWKFYNKRIPGEITFLNLMKKKLKQKLFEHMINLEKYYTNFHFL